MNRWEVKQGDKYHIIYADKWTEASDGLKFWSPFDELGKSEIIAWFTYFDYLKKAGETTMSGENTGET